MKSFTFGFVRFVLWPVLVMFVLFLVFNVIVHILR